MRWGRRLAAKYTEEFWDLACCLNWPEDILVSSFKDGLNDDLYTACIARPLPPLVFMTGVRWLMRWRSTKTETSIVAAMCGRDHPQRERGRLLKPKPSHNAPPPAPSVEKKVIRQQSAEQTTPSRKEKQLREEKWQDHNPE